MSTYTVSQIARRTGITVRALHHYEAEGLIAPARRSDAGYRLYGRDELMRLQHIVSLKSLGFSLAEALARQVDRLRSGIVRQQTLLFRLERIARRAADGETIDADALLSSIEASTTMEKYFTDEQMKTIEARGAALGRERIEAVQQEWPGVIAGMKAAMELGKPADADEVQALARRWRTLLREFTGGDAGIQQSANRMFAENADEMRARTGIDPKLMAYARAAIGLLPKE